MDDVRLLFISLITVCLIINRHVTGLEPYPCPGNCVCNMLIDRVDAWFPRCQLESVSKFTDLTLLSANRTRNLDITCSEYTQPGSLGDGAFQHFTHLESVSLMSCDLTSLGTETLAGVSGLEELFIVGASGSNPYSGLRIDSGALRHDGLKKISSVSLIASHIREIPSFELCGLKHLQELNLTVNQIFSEEKLGLGMAGNFVKCETINGTGSCMDCELPDLESLDLSNNQLSQFGIPLSMMSKQLRIIYFRRNLISSISPDIFQNLTNLEDLDLANNQLSTLHIDQFLGLKNLSRLSMAFNKITHLPKGLFRETTNLIFLDLQGNKLDDKVLDNGVFGALSNLQELWLSQNLISDLQECGSFANMTGLKMLYLHGNALNYIPNNCFVMHSALLEVFLYANKLHLGNLSFTGLDNLLSLSIGNNPLHTIEHGVFSPFRTSLQYLQIRNCQLDLMPMELRGLSQLDQLDLSYNIISQYNADAFLGLGKLRFLLLVGNRIEELPNDAFRNVKSLLLIDLSNNQIKILQYLSFKGLNSLQVINLNNNRIKNIETIFGLLPNLQQLLLKNNSIEVLTRRDRNFPASLVNVDISNNKIKEIKNKPFLGMPDLKTVDLRWNAIESFLRTDLEVSTGWVRPGLLLQYNPIMCDCYMPWLLTYNPERYNSIIILDLRHIRCSNDGRTLMIIPWHEFMCEVPRLCTSSDYAGCPCCKKHLFGIKPGYCRDSCWTSCPEGCKCFTNDNQSHIRNITVSCENQNMTQIPPNIPNTTLEFVFTGNHIESLQPGMFQNLTHLEVLRLHDNAISYLAPNSFSGTPWLKELDLHGNQLTSLHQWMFLFLKNELMKLYLSDNKIHTIDNDTFSLLVNLHTLDLHDNNLLFVQPSLAVGKALMSLNLAGNPWSCDCEHGPQTQEFLLQYTEIVDNINSVICDPDKEWSDWLHANSSSGITPTTTTTRTTREEDSKNENTLLKYSKAELDKPEEDANATAHSILQANFDFCYPSNFSSVVVEKLVQEKAHIIAMSVAGALFLVSVTIALLVYSLRELIKLWLFKHFGLRFYHPKEEEDKKYDAFISYSSKDEGLVIRTIAPKLEAMDPPYKLCLHYRDWPVGASVADTIIQSVQNSRRTILLVSDDFVKSEWCQYEFQAAHHQVLKDKKTRLIIILLNDIPPKHLDAQLRLYIKTNTYLKWNDPRFWERLRYVMPDLTVAKTQGKNDVKETKLDLEILGER